MYCADECCHYSFYMSQSVDRFKPTDRDWNFYEAEKMCTIVKHDLQSYSDVRGTSGSHYSQVVQLENTLYNESLNRTHCLTTDSDKRKAHTGMALISIQYYFFF